MGVVRRIAVFLMVLGFASVGLYFMDYSFRIISWLDDYQPGAGLAIGGVGLLLLLVTIAVEKKPAPAQVPVPPQA
ncbi:hypothetical protein [Actinokineospora sp. HUAS TT18]|uniref:hypothetical protein n=1 Tax=Actinokineospora sp. HUAS TT18 TaxID=3447451 RepID=UPI003F51D113